VAKSNGRNNTVDSLVVDDSISSGSIEIREHIVQFYTRLYSQANIRGQIFLSCTLSPTGSLFSWKRIWRNKVSLGVAFFMSTTTLGKILILDNLRKRHYNVIVMD
jgi:hypothetical protein